jgi:hypothetical protein
MPMELTKKEDEIINEYILLPLAYKVLVNDTKAIDGSKLKFKRFYYELIEQALKQLSHDIRDVKAEVRKQKIKMIKHGDLDYEAVVRGWTYKIVIHSSLAKEWVENRIAEYMHETKIKEGKS